ncbi:MAG TPA: acyltransferase family protein [Mucilaginibacter sp.]
METSQRQTYLDWLRILSIAGVLFFHSAMPYTAYDDWHIKNKETSHLVMEVIFFMHLFRMPLLFFISGTVSYYMMQRRSSLNFIGLRFRRLFVPLAVGMFIVVPPQIYMERLGHGFKGSVWDFYKTTFDFIPYPKGNFSWHHLWFIAYLFLYDLLFAPLFAWLVSPKSWWFKEALSGLAKGKWVYVIAIPGIVWYALLKNNFPETNDLIHDYCFFVYWLFFLLAGFICIIQPKLMDSLERNRRFAITIAFLSLLFVDYLRWNQFDPLDTDSHNMLAVFLSNALRPVIAWSWILALVGYGKRYLNRPHRSLNYLNQAVYPFYIVHQTVIVVISYYIVETQNESILSKYLFTVVVTFFVTTGIYHLLIKPYGLMRFLFGMKPKNEVKPVKIEESIEVKELVVA